MSNEPWKQTFHYKPNSFIFPIPNINSNLHIQFCPSLMDLLGAGIEWSGSNDTHVARKPCPWPMLWHITLWDAVWLCLYKLQHNDFSIPPPPKRLNQLIMEIRIIKITGDLWTLKTNPFRLKLQPHCQHLLFSYSTHIQLCQDFRLE